MNLKILLFAIGSMWDLSSNFFMNLWWLTHRQVDRIFWTILIIFTIFLTLPVSSKELITKDLQRSTIDSLATGNFININDNIKITSDNIIYAIQAIREQTNKDKKIKNLPNFEVKIYKIAMAIAKVESNFDPKAIGELGTIGLFQIKPSTAKEISNKYKLGYDEPYTDLKDSQKNTIVAIFLLLDNFKYTYSYNDIIYMFNQGPSFLYSKKNNGKAYFNKVQRELDQIEFYIRWNKEK